MVKKRNQTGVPIFPLWVRLLLTVSAVSTILYFSIVPPPGSRSISYGPLAMLPRSIWMHLGSYLALAVVIGYASYTLPWIDWQLWVFITTVGIGISIEVLQYMLPTRTFSLVDIGVNALGAAIGILLLSIIDWVVRSYRNTRRNTRKT